VEADRWHLAKSSDLAAGRCRSELRNACRTTSWTVPTEPEGRLV